MLYFPGEKEKKLKYASKILSDKVNFCNEYQLERTNNRVEGCYVCTNCSECELCFFSVANYRDMPSGRIRQYSYESIKQ